MGAIAQGRWLRLDRSRHYGHSGSPVPTKEARDKARSSPHMFLPMSANRGRHYDHQPHRRPLEGAGPYKQNGSWQVTLLCKDPYPAWTTAYYLVEPPIHFEQINKSPNVPQDAPSHERAAQNNDLPGMDFLLVLVFSRQASPQRRRYRVGSRL